MVFNFLVYGFLLACLVVGAFSFTIVVPLEDMVLTSVLAAVVPPSFVLVAPLVAIIGNWSSLVGLVGTEILATDEGVFGG